MDNIRVPLTTLSAKTWLSSNYYWVVSGFLTLAVSLRGITATPLSHDEFYSLNAVTEGIHEHLWEAPIIPYYAFLWLWTGGGNFTTDFWMRLLSVLAIVGLAITTAVITKNLMNKWAGLAAGIIIAISPASQKFALQARVYALAVFILTLALYFLIKAITRNHTKFWVFYSVTLVLGGVMAPFGLVVIAGHFIFLFSHKRLDQGQIKRWLIACSPLIPILLVGIGLVRSFSGLHEWATKPTLTNLPNAIEWLGASGALPTPAAGAFGFGLVVLAAVSKVGSKWLWASIIGAISIWVVSLGPMTFWSGNYFFSLMPLITIGAALTLGSLSHMRILGILALFAILAYSSFVELRTINTREPDLRLAAGYVVENQELSTEIFDGGGSFELGQAIRHYHPNEEALIFAAEPSTPYWAIYVNEECESSVILSISDDVNLQLCESR